MFLKENQEVLSVGNIRITPQLRPEGVFFLVFLGDDQEAILPMDEVVKLFDRQGVVFQVWSRIIRGILGSNVPEEIKECFRKLITVAVCPPVRVNTPPMRRRGGRKR